MHWRRKYDDSERPQKKQEKSGLENDRAPVFCIAAAEHAELETLNEQIAQQKTENEEMQRILSGNADQITEWVARDSYNYAAPNERIFVDVTGN